MKFQGPPIFPTKVCSAICFGPTPSPPVNSGASQKGESATSSGKKWSSPSSGKTNWIWSAGPIRWWRTATSFSQRSSWWQYSQPQTTAESGTTAAQWWKSTPIWCAHSRCCDPSRKFHTRTGPEHPWSANRKSEMINPPLFYNCGYIILAQVLLIRWWWELLAKLGWEVGWRWGGMDLVRRRKYFRWVSLYNLEGSLTPNTCFKTNLIICLSLVWILWDSGWNFMYTSSTDISCRLTMDSKNLFPSSMIWTPTFKRLKTFAKTVHKVTYL